MPDQIAKAMPDAMAKWTPTPDWTEVEIVRESWSAKPVLGLSMALVAGNIASAISTLAPHLSEVGLWQVAIASDHVIRIARDKALIVTSAPMLFETGWNAAGFSVTDASSAYGVLEIAGRTLPDILAEATAADFNVGSRSASLLFADVACLVTRTAPGIARVTIEISHIAHLWRWLETRTERN